MIGDLTFFTLVWHVAQAIVFTVLAVWAFHRLARVSSQDALSGTGTLGLDKAAAS
jgi:hypothetical protein